MVLVCGQYEPRSCVCVIVYLLPDTQHTLHRRYWSFWAAQMLCERGEKQIVQIIQKQQKSEEEEDNRYHQSADWIWSRWSSSHAYDSLRFSNFFIYVWVCNCMWMCGWDRCLRTILDERKKTKKCGDGNDKEIVNITSARRQFPYETRNWDCARCAVEMIFGGVERTERSLNVKWTMNHLHDLVPVIHIHIVDIVAYDWHVQFLLFRCDTHRRPQPTRSNTFAIG